MDLYVCGTPCLALKQSKHLEFNNLGYVRLAGLSPDGRCIVFGSHDSMVRLCNTFSGTEVMSPFRGHQDVVRSVEFRTHIVSGSDDMTMRVLDAALGIEVIPPLRSRLP